MKKTLLLLSVFMLNVFLATPQVAARGKIETFEQSRELFFRTPPKVTGMEGPNLLVEFDTTVPVANVRLLFGIVSHGKRLERTLLRRSGNPVGPDADLPRTHHIFKVKVSKLEYYEYGSHLIQDGGGTIAFRVEAFDAEAGKLRLAMGRCAYRRVGEPGVGLYERVPCITEGPFVDKVTSDGAVISWETDLPTRGRVLYTLASGRQGEAQTGFRGLRHEVVLSDLNVRESVKYVVDPGDKAFPSKSATFRTAPAPGSRQPIRFGFMSDSRSGVGSGDEDFNGVNGRVLSSLLAGLARDNADFIIFGGDLIDGYSSSLDHVRSQFQTWKTFSQPVGAHIPTFELMGNHEMAGMFFKIPDPDDPGEFLAGFRDRNDPDSIEAIFTEELVNPRGSVYGFGSPEPEIRADQVQPRMRFGPDYGETVFSMNWGNVHVVFVNSNYWTSAIFGDVPWSSRPFAEIAGSEVVFRILSGNREGYIMNNQMAWLDRDLAAAQADPDIDVIFVTTHEPAYPNGGHLTDAMYWGERNSTEDTGLNDPKLLLGDVTAMRDRFLTTMMKYPKVLALLTGDEHNYSRMALDGSLKPYYRRRIWQFVSGGAGAPYYLQNLQTPWHKKVRSFSAVPHYCLFEVEGPKVSVTVISDDGEVIDRVADLAGEP